MAWTLGILLAFGVVGAIAIQFAILRDGPAVLNAIDRVTGGDGGAHLKAIISTGEHSQQKLLVWGPEKRDPHSDTKPVLLFVHGGSWRSGDPAGYDFVGRAFVREGFIVVLAGYRLGKDGRYPAMLEDTARAIAWTHEEIAAYGGDPQRIVLAGHSAGAYNVVMATLEEQWLRRHELAISDISGVVGLSGPYDFVPFDSDSTIASFGHVEEPNATQPLSHLRPDAPPMLLIHGEKDTLVRPRNTRVLAESLGGQGASALAHFYPEMSHNDPLISLASPWRSRRDVVEMIAGFARDATNRDKTSVSVQTQTG